MSKLSEIREKLEKSQKGFVSYDLSEELAPTVVTEWIPTSSRWLDSVICRGKLAGIPVGKIVELAGEESSGKSYMAAQIVKNAQMMGFNCFYFDSESAIDPNFWKQSGCDLGNVLYIPAKTVEFVFETIEQILSENNRNLFVLDSYAFTPCKADLESDFNPNSSIALKPRISSVALRKLIQPISEQGSTLLILNQLRKKIHTGPMAHIESILDPWSTPGGKALDFAYSLRIWLEAKETKKSFVVDERGYKVGTEVLAKIKKSRFGSDGRTCSFKIIWGDYSNIGIQDEQSWLDAIKNSPRIKSGSWYKITEKDSDNALYTFRQADFSEMCKNDENFRNLILTIMDEEVIVKFDNRTGDASQYYHQKEKKDD